MARSPDESLDEPIRIVSRRVFSPPIGSDRRNPALLGRRSRVSAYGGQALVEYSLAFLDRYMNGVAASPILTQPGPEVATLLYDPGSR